MTIADNRVFLSSQPSLPLHLNGRFNSYLLIGLLVFEVWKYITIMYETLSISLRNAYLYLPPNYGWTSTGLVSACRSVLAATDASKMSFLDFHKEDENILQYTPVTSTGQGSRLLIKREKEMIILCGTCFMYFYVTFCPSKNSVFIESFWMFGEGNFVSCWWWDDIQRLQYSILAKEMLKLLKRRKKPETWNCKEKLKLKEGNNIILVKIKISNIGSTRCCHCPREPYRTIDIRGINK